MSAARIYLDHAATSTVRPEVVEAMVPWLGRGYNASSLHAEGRAARAALDDARTRVAAVLGVRPREIVFTGGGSEADSIALLGAARARGRPGRFVTTAIEHHAVLHAADRLEEDGWEVTRLPVDAEGRIDPAAFEAEIRGAALASVMLANNELGTVQPVARCAVAARSAGALFHTDAVQAAGSLELSTIAEAVDLLALSAHKFEGPKGVGVLFVRDGTPLAPIAAGGGQEHGLRPGTEDVAGIVGLATALELAAAERPQRAARIAAQRDRFESALLAAVPDAIVLGGSGRLPQHLTVAFADAPSDALLAALDLEGIAASAGSACAAGALEPSHVVAALRLPERYARGAIRFTLGRTTTDAQLDRALGIIPGVVARVRGVPLSV